MRGAVTSSHRNQEPARIRPCPPVALFPGPPVANRFALGGVPQSGRARYVDIFAQPAHTAR
jgi:hypothetical protein